MAKRQKLDFLGTSKKKILGFRELEKHDSNSYQMKEFKDLGCASLLKEKVAEYFPSAKL